MRKNLAIFCLVVFVLLCSCFAVSVEADSSTWSQIYGGKGDDYAYSSVATSDGGYAIAGSTESFGAGARDCWLIKIDASGNLEWNKTYGGTGNESARSLVATSDGGYALGGAGLLIKTDAYGNMLWNKTYEEDCSILIATSDGGYAIACSTDSFGHIGPDDSTNFMLIKTDSVGNVEWNRTYSNGNSETAYVLAETSDGGYAIGGTEMYCITAQPGSTLPLYSSTRYVLLLVKFDATGNLEWNQTYSKGIRTFVQSLVATSDGGYAMAGYAGEVGRGGSENFDCFLIKADEFGNMLWSQTYVPHPHRSDEGYAHSLVETSDGGYAIAGIAHIIFSGGGDFWLVKVDEFGNMEWNQTYGEEYFDSASSLVVMSDGGYVISGCTQSEVIINSKYVRDYDIVTIKTDSFGVAPEFPLPDAISPVITFNSPPNKLYLTDSVTFPFTVDENTSWMGYSLDGQDNVSLTENTIDLTGLPDGSHALTIYAMDAAQNIGTSETVYFTVDTRLLWIMITALLVAVASITILIYVIKRRKAKQPKQLKLASF